MPLLVIAAREPRRQRQDKVGNKGEPPSDVGRRTLDTPRCTARVESEIETVDTQREDGQRE